MITPIPFAYCRKRCFKNNKLSWCLCSALWGFVPSFLEQSRITAPHYREETITDIFRYNLSQLGLTHFRIEILNEAKTGTDMQWIFYQRSTNSSFRVNVQAKKEDPKNKSWSTRNFPELKHRVKGQFQYDILITKSKACKTPAYPIYLFYQFQDTLAKASNVNPPKNGSDKLGGVNWMPAWIIKYLFDNKKHPFGSLSSPNNTHFKRYEHLARYFAHPCDFFCSSNGRNPTPQEARDVFVSYQKMMMKIYSLELEVIKHFDIPALQQDKAPDIKRMLSQEQILSYHRPLKNEGIPKSKILILSE